MAVSEMAITEMAVSEAKLAFICDMSKSYSLLRVSGSAPNCQIDS